MELALEPEFIKPFSILQSVSILVLMELALELFTRRYTLTHKVVSILVLMELALERHGFVTNKMLKISFNPCFNGTCFRTTTSQV